MNWNLFRSPTLRNALKSLFDTTTGHDHDGTNSKSLSPAAVVGDDSVTTVKIQDDAVTTAKINDAAVTVDKMAVNAVTTDKIANTNITEGKIDTGAVTATKIGTGAVIAAKLGAKSVETAKIDDLAVTAGQIASDAVIEAKILNANVTANKIASDAVVTAKIQNGAVTADKIGTNAVITAKINNDAVDKDKINADVAGDGLGQNGDGSLEVNVDDSTVETNADTLRVKALGVDTAQLAANAVETAKINDDAVTNDKLANITRGSVKVGGAANAPTDLVALTDKQILVGDGTDIKSVAMSGDVHIANTGATTIQPDAVETAMITDKNVTLAKIENVDDGKILVGDGETPSRPVAVNVSGDATLAAGGALTIGAGKVTSAMLTDTASPTAKTIADPGHAAAIPVTGNGDLALTIGSAGAETNTLAVPTFAGQVITVSADTVGTGSRVVTVASAINATGNDTITFDSAGDFISLYGIKLGASFAWRVLASDGAVLSTA